MKAILITSSILILVLAALRPVLRGRFRPQAQYALWLVVAVRLLVPLETVPSAFSALALLDRAEESARVAQAIGETVLPVPAMSYEDAIAQAYQEHGGPKPPEDGAIRWDADQWVIDRSEELMRGPTLAELAERYARPIWLAGAALMAAWFLLVNLRLRRKLRRALPVEAADCPLPVYVTPELPSPCLCGVFRPAVYVTPAALADPDRLRHVLAHELTHYRHKDHWWALVRCACLCVYWFDPLVWWAAAMSRQDCELACDAGAIRRLGEAERLSYGRTLVAMIAEGRTPLLQTATTMTGSKRRVKERVELIARRPKTVAALSLGLALLMGLVVGCTFTGAPKEPSELSAGDPVPLASDALSAATLLTRLLDVPDELHTEVNALQGGESTAITHFAPSVVVQYWMNRPYTNYEEGWGWLMTVYQWDQAQFEEYYSVLSGGWECFARDENFYYVTARATDVRVPASEEMVAEMPGATEVETRYLEDFEAIRAFAKKTVLETKGVEPYDSNPPQPLETLQARLLGVPEELRDNVEAHADDGALAVYYFKKPGEELNRDQYLLIVNQRSEEDLQRLYDESSYPVGGSRWFAKCGGRYYVFQWNTSIEYDLEDEEQFNAASRAVREFAEKTVLETEGAEPFQLEETPAQAIKAITDQLLAAPAMEMDLSLDSIGYPSCSIDPSTGNGPYFLNNLAASFQWEAFDWGTTEDPQFPLPDQTSRLSLHTPYSSEVVYIRVYQGSDLVAVHDAETGTNWYHATDPYGLTPFQYLRSLYDESELVQLRVTSVPDRGQNHQDVVKEWLEGYEGAYTKCSPGSRFACTYVEGRDVESDQPDWMDDEQLERFAQDHGLEASEFTKTWFAFRYSLLFVPADEYVKDNLMAGNTHEYDGAGKDAPEGAMVYTRQAIMRLVDGKWTCTETGTGW